MKATGPFRVTFGSSSKSVGHVQILTATVLQYINFPFSPRFRHSFIRLPTHSFHHSLNSCAFHLCTITLFIAVSYNGGQVLEEHVAIAATAIIIIIINNADLYMFTVNCKDYHALHMAV